ncbi:hypothetical protein AYO21_02849 [Fonsecaea monophora]|uniref:Uncharacterized protein n=1 Tax=Fonsecaea monophora TaxID=254056 RepID=A0A177FFC7_9EURO|nr:hypothetical protein AYO21_02849 [Fonsecaea monophora]OAG42898.1 hypothetical protein AYO21_02849 [Fonsecaea monophora]
MTFSTAAAGTWLSAIGVVLISLVLIRILKLIVHYIEARKLGVSLIVTPVSWQDPLWLIFWRRFAWIRNLPFGGWLDFSYISWSVSAYYHPHQKLGDAFAVVRSGHNELYVNDPTAVQEIMSRWKIWIKPPEQYDIFNLFGPNVVSINGEDWQRHRKIAAAVFKESNHRLVWTEAMRQSGQMCEEMKRRQDTTNGGLTLKNVETDVALAALHVLSAVGLGQSYDFAGGLKHIVQGQHRVSYAESLSFIFRNIFLVWIFRHVKLPSFLLPQSIQNVHLNLHEFREYIRESIARFNAQSDAKADIVSSLVRANEAAKREKVAGQKGFFLSDEELYGNFFVLNLGGYETTAGALTFTIPSLARYQDVQEWLREEVDRVVAKTDNYDEAFPLLVRCLATMYETLRIHGPLPDDARYSLDTQVLQVGDKKIVVPPKTYVTPNIYAVHTDPRYWGPDSMEWKPSRWITRNAEGKEVLADPPQGALFAPWLAGPRICPGKKFSQVEFVAVLVGLLRKYRVGLKVRRGQTKEEAQDSLLKAIYDKDIVTTPVFKRPYDASIVIDEQYMNIQLAGVESRVKLRETAQWFLFDSSFPVDLGKDERPAPKRAPGSGAQQFYKGAFFNVNRCFE